MEKWDYEFDIEIETLLHDTYKYGIEADTPNDAIKCAIEFFEDDHPEEAWICVTILEQREMR